MNELFQTYIICAQTVLDCSDADLSRMLRVSRPTIGRWKTGASAPHPLGQQAVATTLNALMEATRNSPERVSW